MNILFLSEISIFLPELLHYATNNRHPLQFADEIKMGKRKKTNSICNYFHILLANLIFNKLKMLQFREIKSTWATGPLFSLIPPNPLNEESEFLRLLGVIESRLCDLKRVNKILK
jgi:hypothetical protein